MRNVTTLVVALSVIVIGCHSTSVQLSENPTLDNAPPSVVASAIESRGFAPVKRELTTPTTWEITSFAMRMKRTTWFRAREPLPNQDDAYYCRFRLFEETFASESDAMARLARIRDVAPDERVEEAHISALRRGFRVGTAVYILGTDAVMFEPEVARLALDLASGTPGAVAEARRNQALPN